MSIPRTIAPDRSINSITRTADKRGVIPLFVFIITPDLAPKKRHMIIIYDII
jgi:hypothetical protein